MTRRLLWAWWLLIVYGSFIPFRIDAGGAWRKLADLRLLPFEAGVKNFSIPDVASNVLLYVPLGFLFAAVRRQAGAGWAGAVAAATLAAVGGALVVETGQLFLAGRVSSLIDVQANTVGAALGALGACLFLGRFAGGMRLVAHRLRAEPELLGAALLVLLLAAQSFYPFALTLDVVTLAASVKHGHWVPWHGPRGFAVDTFVRHGVPYGLLAGFLAVQARSRHAFTAATLGATAAVAAIGLGLEVGKLFFAGRYPNLANVVAGSLGAFLGAVVAARSGASSIRAVAPVAFAWLAYMELSPFRFVSLHRALARVPRIEWLPLASHLRAAPESMLFDVWTKLLAAALLGVALGARGWNPRRVALAGIVVGLGLEALQLFVPPRIPSTTDVLLFGLGAWLGAHVYRKIALPSEPHATPASSARSTAETVVRARVNRPARP